MKMLILKVIFYIVFKFFEEPDKMAKGKAVEFQVHMKTEETFQNSVLEDDENLWGKWPILLQPHSTPTPPAQPWLNPSPLPQESPTPTTLLHPGPVPVHPGPILVIKFDPIHRAVINHIDRWHIDSTRKIQY